MDYDCAEERICICMTDEERRLLREKLRAAKASGDFDGAPKPARKVRTGLQAVKPVEEDVPQERKKVRPVKEPKQVKPEPVHETGDEMPDAGGGIFGLIKKILIIGGAILLIFIIGIMVASRFIKPKSPEPAEQTTTEAKPEATTEEKETHPNYTGFLKKYDWKNKSYAMTITAGDKTGIYEVSQSDDAMAMRLVSGEEEISRFMDKEMVFMSVGGAEKKWYRTARKDAKPAASTALKDTVIPADFTDWLTVCGINADVLDAAEWAKEENDNAANTVKDGQNEETQTVDEKIYDVLTAKDLSEGTEHSYYVNRASRKVEKIVITGSYAKEDGGTDTFTKEILVRDVNRIEKADSMDTAKEVSWDKFLKSYQEGMEKIDPVLLSLMEAPVKEEAASEETTTEATDASKSEEKTTEAVESTEGQETTEVDKDSSESKEETKESKDKSSDAGEDTEDIETSTAPVVE